MAKSMMGDEYYEDLQSMDVDESQRVAFNATVDVRARSQAVSKRDRQGVIDITESSASSPAKSQRKDKQANVEGEVNSNPTMRGYAQKKATSEAFNKNIRPSLGKSPICKSQSIAEVAPLSIRLSRPIAQCSQGVGGTSTRNVARENSRLAPGNIVGSSDHHTLPLLCITDLSETTPRFAIQGKVLNNYGTYKLRVEDAKFPRYFKVDIVDVRNSDTVTIVVEESLLAHFVSKFPVGRYIRIEGASIKRKNKVDGGTSTYSLYVDSATIVTEATPFTITLSFYPEQGIRSFLDEAHVLHTRGTKQHLGTLAFVVIQTNNLEVQAGATRGELLIADGPTLGDRATLTFVNDRKDDYANVVKDVEAGSIVMFVARNIGVFMTRDNTLSVLDLTILVDVRSAGLRQELLDTHDKHMEYLGYGKEVHGDLVFVNINGVLLEVVCYICKSNKVHKTVDGTYCVACAKSTRPLEIAHLHAKINVDKEGTISTQLVGPIVDKVLHLQKPFRQLYSESVIGVREMLACTFRIGLFKLNRAGNICDFVEAKK